MTYPIEEIKSDWKKWPSMGLHDIAKRHGLTVTETYEIIAHDCVSQATQTWAADLRERLETTHA